MGYVKTAFWYGELGLLPALGVLLGWNLVLGLTGKRDFRRPKDLPWGRMAAGKLRRAARRVSARPVPPKKTIRQSLICVVYQFWQKEAIQPGKKKSAGERGALRKTRRPPPPAHTGSAAPAGA